jgi:hypothetical protein
MRGRLLTVCHSIQYKHYFMNRAIQITRVVCVSYHVICDVSSSAPAFVPLIFTARIRKRKQVIYKGFLVDISFVPRRACMGGGLIIVVVNNELTRVITDGSQGTQYMVQNSSGNERYALYRVFN